MIAAISSFVVVRGYVCALPSSVLVAPGAALFISENQLRSPGLRAAAQELVQIFHIRLQRSVHDVSDRLPRLQVSV